MDGDTPTVSPAAPPVLPPSWDARRANRGRPVRVGVGLGPSGVIFSVSTALIIAAALATQANLLFWGIGIMAGVLSVSIAWPWISVRALAVERLGMTHGVVGERVNLRYTVRHRGRLPAFAVVITELWGQGSRGWRKAGPTAEKPPRLTRPPTGWIMHLGPRQQVQAEAPCWPMRRGHLRFERIRVSTSFPFGILRFWGDIPQASEVRVYPHIYRVRRGVLDGVSQLDRDGTIASDKPGGVEEFFGVREYRHGDRPRQIDWKRASRIGRLVTREFTRPGPPRIDLVLDLTEAQPGEGVEPVTDKPWEEDRVERAVSLAASIACEAHLQGYELGMTVLGADCPSFAPRHNPQHRARMLDALATLRVAPHAALPSPGRATLVIRLGRGEAAAEAVKRGMARRRITLGAADLHRYVVPASSRRILAESPRTEQRRSRRLHQVAWTDASRTTAVSGAGPVPRDEPQGGMAHETDAPAPAEPNAEASR